MRKQWILALAALATASAAAQDFPAHPVRIIVPWPASGNVDITARTIAPAMSEALGQQVIVDNRAGAAGRIGTTAVAKSPADGYTLLLGSSGTVTAGPAVFKNLSYDPVKDLVAIGPIQSVPIVLTAAPKTPVSTYKEFVALANSKPGGPGPPVITVYGSSSADIRGSTVQGGGVGILESGNSRVDVYGCTIQDNLSQGLDVSDSSSASIRPRAGRKTVIQGGNRDLPH